MKLGGAESHIPTQNQQRLKLIGRFDDESGGGGDRPINSLIKNLLIK